MISSKKKYHLIQWRRINMRNVTHLLGVEFIHDLYNRHLPRINSIRFRNVVTLWRDGIVNSFAPEEEWELLSQWLGEKFIRLNPILIREVNKLVNSESSFLDNFLRSFPKDLTLLDNVELGLLLLDLQSFVLGEIYRVNLVQIEHAITAALLKLLGNYIKDENKKVEILSYIIAPNELTEFQKEKQNFLKIVKLGQRMGIKNPLKNKRIRRLLVQHYQKYAYLNCAYGELPRNFGFYIKEYKKLFPQNLKKFNILKKVRKKYKKGQELLAQINDKKIRILSNLMAKVGIFRDKNKAKLGKTIRYRLMILNEIARRRLEKREALNYYLLSEILKLLSEKKKVPAKIITLRKKEGITLYRQECLENGIPTFFTSFKKAMEKKCLKGICASPGIVMGKCKVVISKKDIKRIRRTNILVAIGTDFDLLEGIYKAAGVITEEGGILSHAAVVCREMGKPCCIGVKGATQILEGKKVKLDASQGIIEII